MVKENTLTLAIRTNLRWLNHLNRAPANANLAVGKLGGNLERILARALTKSTGKSFDIA